MSGYIGNIPVPQATQTRDTFTATAGQTTFATSGYTPSFLDVFLNGVHLVNGTDYTASNGSDVVLTSGAAAGDTLEVVSYSTFEVNSQTFTGTTTLTGDLQATTATFSGAVTGTDATLSGGVYLGGTGAANYLDDYEEGSWEPEIKGGTSSPTVTYQADTGGYYIKTGRMVFVTGTVRWTALSGGSGSAYIGGLPFSVSARTNGDNADGTNACRVLLWNGTSTLVPTIVKTQQSSSLLNMMSARHDANTATLQVSDCGTTGYIAFNMTYYTS